MKVKFSIGLIITLLMISWDSYSGYYSYYSYYSYTYSYRISFYPSSRYRSSRPAIPYLGPVTGLLDTKPISKRDNYNLNKSKVQKSLHRSWENGLPYKKFPKNQNQLKLAQADLDNEISSFNKTYSNCSDANIRLWNTSETKRNIHKWSSQFYIRTDDQFLNSLDLFILAKRNFIVKLNFFKRYINPSGKIDQLSIPDYFDKNSDTRYRNSSKPEIKKITSKYDYDHITIRSPLDR